MYIFICSLSSQRVETANESSQNIIQVEHVCLCVCVVADGGRVRGNESNNNILK